MRFETVLLIVVTSLVLGGLVMAAAHIHPSLLAGISAAGIIAWTLYRHISRDKRSQSRDDDD